METACGIRRNSSSNPVMLQSLLSLSRCSVAFLFHLRVLIVPSTWLIQFVSARSQATEHRAIELVAGFPEEPDELERFSSRRTAVNAIQHRGEFGIFSLSLIDGVFVVRHSVGPDVDLGGI